MDFASFLGKGTREEIMRGIIAAVSGTTLALAIALAKPAQGVPITCANLDVVGGSSPQSPTLVPPRTCTIRDLDGVNHVHVNDNNPVSTYEFGWGGGDLTITVQLTTANNTDFT